MAIDEDSSPSERARVRLSALIEHSDELGNACTYDVWPYAASRDVQTPFDAAEISHWKALHAGYAAACHAWAGPFMRSPEKQLLAARRCLRLKKQIADGDGGAVLEAVATCAAHGLVMPAWLSAAFVDRYQRVVTGQARDWNAEKAFGAALPKGGNVAGVRARVVDAPWAYETALKLLAADPAMAIDQGLYEEIGCVVGKGHSQVQALIAGYVRSDPEGAPPLSDIKAKLQAGHDLVGALLELQLQSTERWWRAHSVSPAEDGGWQYAGDPEKS